MGKAAERKRGGSRKSRSNIKGSDDSDEDYRMEEDEDYSMEEDAQNVSSDDEEEEEAEEEQYCSDSFVSGDKVKENFEVSEDEEEIGQWLRPKRKKSNLVWKTLGTRASNQRRHVQKRNTELNDEDYLKKLEDAEVRDFSRPKRKRSLNQQEASNTKKNAQRQTDDEDSNIEEEEDNDDDKTDNVDVSEEEEAVTEATRSKQKSGCSDPKKSGTKASKNKKNGQKDTDDEDYNFEEDEQDDEEEVMREGTRSKHKTGCSDQNNLDTKASNNRRNGQRDIDDEDYNIDDDEELDEDEELSVDEDDSLEEELEEVEEEEEEEELAAKKITKYNKVNRKTSRKRSSGNKKRKTRRSTVTDSKSGNKRKRHLTRKTSSEDDEYGNDFEDEDFTDTDKVRSRRMNKKKPRTRNRLAVLSDSDSIDSGPSEVELTISEEEREQVREAIVICQTPPVPLRAGTNKIQYNESFSQQRKPFTTKGKEKVQEMKNEVVKQVCGICLSEEGRRTVRGTLNCCSHYFCFTCICEWSEVESRCPLCKQRFLTISKPAKAITGVDLRDIVLQIPERDQVYQPTEDEIRGYLDPYENVICTECHEGGDDNLMLLCDLCDSPAHTYCVGLGREVPEGNWYCEGCRPVSLGSSNNQSQDSMTGQRNLYHRLSSFESVRDDFDGSLSIPSTPFPQGFGGFLSPRYIGTSVQAPSPRAGTGVGTVSARRQLQRQIQSMLSNTRFREIGETPLGVSGTGTNHNSSQIHQTHSRQRTSTHLTAPEIGTSVYTHMDGQIQNFPSHQTMQFVPETSNDLEGQLFLDIVPRPMESYFQEIFRPSTISVLHNDHFSNMTADIGLDNHLSSSTLGEGSNFFIEQQVNSLVQAYLSSMSSTLSLDAGTLEDISRKSTNTILAAYGCDHLPNEVYSMHLQPCCSHVGDAAMQASPIKGHCHPCFDQFTKEVVKAVMNSKLPHFLHVRN